ncbi:hypothetical protein [Cyanobium sp. AMD-g]|uniref:hypothetical protein n=1 Tax=Cyanobium sp. AMD-g TaxID=2823699 RepID=UPI0020CDF8C8|nr:hypothetical protein [Cyanobium sp. AMD-g]
MSSSTTSESMARTLRWGLGLLLVVSLSIGAFLLLPFRSWLPGGTVGDVPLSQVVNGTAFNRLFPEPDDGDQLVFTQEKRGFSEARLKHGGQVKALLAISDVTTAPEARRKFETSQSRLQGWPLVEQGPQATALLVADRFQIKVIGQGDGLAAEQRQDLIGRFNLRGLAALKSASAPRASLPSSPDSAGLQSLEQRAAMEPVS